MHKWHCQFRGWPLHLLNRRRRFGAHLIVFGLLILPRISWAQFQDVESGYGRGHGAGFARSLNGTSILQELFTSAGRRVEKARRITPRIESYQTIVWVPDRLKPPDTEVVNRLDLWLKGQSNRTLIYVGRDYDARISYWQELVPQLKGEQKELAQRRLAEVLTEHANRQQEFDVSSPNQPWFRLALDLPKHVTRVRGPWMAGEYSTDVNIQLGGARLIPLEESSYFGSRSKILLESSAGDPVVFSTMVGGNAYQSRVLVVANGSFLLNYPLTNKGNQLLASRLVGEVTAYGSVLFLYSGPDEIAVSNSEIGENEQWAWIGQPPLRYLVPQFLILGVLFCFAYFPILGRPRLAAREERVSFGQHVEAVAGSLRKSTDTNEALKTLSRYRDLERGGGRRNRPAE